MKKKTIKKKIKKPVALNPIASWPHYQQVIFKPERYEYIKKNKVRKRSSECVFCEAASIEKMSHKTHLLYRDDQVLVFQNKFPYNNGHLLVLPRVHCGDLVVLDPQIHSAVMSMVQKALCILKDEYKPQGFNIGMNHGSVSGAGIPEHLHWHIIPRWFGDTNFFPLIAQTKVLPETTEQMYKRIAPYFKKLLSQ